MPTPTLHVCVGRVTAGHCAPSPLVLPPPPLWPCPEPLALPLPPPFPPGPAPLTLQVQQIQKEYQDFMEKVRSKAQGAIDTANRDYQAAKGLLASRMAIMTDYLQVR